MTRKTPVEKASDEIKEELTDEIRELELKKRRVENDLENLEVIRLKRFYEKKIRFTDYFKSTCIHDAFFYIGHYIDIIAITVIMVAIVIAGLVCGIGAVSSLKGLYLEHVEEDKIAAEKAAVEKQVKEAESIFHDQGGNLWVTDGLVSEERYKKQLPLFTTQHNIASIDVEKGIIEEPEDTWCGCDSKKQIPAIEAWIVVQNNPTQTVEMK